MSFNMSNRLLRILMIDDDEDDALIIRSMLADVSPEGHQIEWLDCADRGLARLSAGDIDIVLLDYRLGGDLGTDWLPHFKRVAPKTPVLLLTGQGDTHADQKAMALGAAGYLVKGDFSAEALHRILLYSIEREAVIDALSQSEWHYRHLFEDHPAACLVYDASHLVILAANKAAELLYGRTLQDSHFHLLFAEPELDWAAYASGLHANLPAQRSRTWRQRHATGDLLDVELVDVPFRYHKRKARLVVALDKSLEIQSERQARESENAMLQLLADSRDAIIATDEQQRIHYANPSAERMLGLETTAWDQAELALPITEKNPFEWTFTASGTSTTFEVVRSHTRLNGQPMHVFALRDITERNRLEAQRRLLERSLASTRNGVLITDAQQPDMPIIYVNAAFESITGYRREQVLGRNCRFLQGTDTEQPGISAIRQAIANNQSINVVLRNYRADGTPFWNDLYIAPVQNEAGTVTHFIGSQNDISEQRAAEHTLAFNASHDVLTGLPNRALLEDRIRQGLQFAQRYQRTLAVLYIDLDGFKPINDTLGHARGDQILIDVSERLQQHTRPGDTLARLSADEFVLVLPDLAQPDDSLAIVETLLSVIRAPYVLEDGQYHLTASIGIALSQAESTEDPMQLVRHADLAMYQAKENGKNQYSWYNPSLNQGVQRALRLRSDLQTALTEHQFRLHYQPVHNLSSSEIVGFEALLRWSHPQLGAISPGDFIPIAETTGQILALSDWVLEQACRDQCQLESLGIKVPIALNMSPILFKKTGLAEQMAATVHRHGLSCDAFELEVLETVMMGRFEVAIESLRKLRDAGFRLSIDDFGTGFSSLSYLKLLPIQKIKIDRSFITEIIQDQDDAAIVRAIISMARHLGLQVVAEGVETKAQAAFLKRELCHDVQGFLYSAARPLESLIDYCQNREGLQSTTPSTNEVPYNLLILDDDPLILKSLHRALRHQGYGVYLAESADDAFRILAQISVQVVVSDQRMPEMSGTEFLKKVRSLYPDTIRIVLSGYTDLATVTGSINEGAIYKFLTKPWDDNDLRAVIRHAFEEAGFQPPR